MSKLQAREMTDIECECDDRRHWSVGDPCPPYAILREVDCGMGSACPLDANGWNGLVVVTHVVAVCTNHVTPDVGLPLLLTHSHQGLMNPADLRVTECRNYLDILADVRAKCTDCNAQVSDEARGDLICRITGMIVEERRLDSTEYVPVERAIQLRNSWGSQHPHVDWTVVSAILQQRLSDAWHAGKSAATAHQARERPSQQQHYHQSQQQPQQELPDHDGYNSDGSPRPRARCAPAGDPALLPVQVIERTRRTGSKKARAPPPPRAGSVQHVTTRDLFGERLMDALEEFIKLLLYGPMRDAVLPSVERKGPLEYSRLCKAVDQYADKPHIPLVELLAAYIYRTSTTTRRGVDHDTRRTRWYAEVIAIVGRIVSYSNTCQKPTQQQQQQAACADSWVATRKVMQNICLGVLYTMREGGLRCTGPRGATVFALPNDAYLAEVLPPKLDVCGDKWAGVTQQQVSAGQKAVKAALRKMMQWINIPATLRAGAAATVCALMQELSAHATLWHDADTLQGRSHQLALLEDLFGSAGKQVRARER